MSGIIENYTGLAETITLSNAGSYAITADGGMGGAGGAGGAGGPGGDGAQVSATFALAAGTVLEIVVGGAGATGTGGGGGGGGGGSFVFDVTTGVLLEAAGGGGGGGYSATYGGGGGVITTAGANGMLSTTNPTSAFNPSVGVGGTAGGGGTGGTDTSFGANGGGGGGVSGGGTNGISGVGRGAGDGGSGGNGGIVLPGAGGLGFGNGGNGGNGGFGGGGGGGWSAGGGGGGYSGGGGGSYYGGGGGGSFVASNASASAIMPSYNTLTAGEVLIAPVCFTEGTWIRTPGGDVAVERLRAGDKVCLSDGAVTEVVWLGVQSVARRFGDPLLVLPIRIKAGALGEGVPGRDLLVSPAHALFVGGVLMQAGALVNGVSVVREYAVPEVFRYYHVELAAHALLLAENTPAESFVDNVEREQFDNWTQREAQHGIVEMDYPRARSARQVPRQIRERLLARGMALFGAAVALGLAAQGLGDAAAVKQAGEMPAGAGRAKRARVPRKAVTAKAA